MKSDTSTRIYYMYVLLWNLYMDSKDVEEECYNDCINLAYGIKNAFEDLARDGVELADDDKNYKRRIYSRLNSCFGV